jgi:hypothetical protein
MKGGWGCDVNEWATNTCGAVLPSTDARLVVTKGNITMILEVAILNIRPGESADFERAFAEAQAIIAAMPGYAPVRARHSFMSYC